MSFAPERVPGRVGRIITCSLLLLALTAWIIPRPAAASVSHPAHRAEPQKRASEPEVCDGCVPPLIYSGGPVMSTSAAGTTVVPIYWAPDGFSFSADYQRIVDGYLANVAAASGSDSNVFSVSTEYYQVVNGQRQYVRYLMQAAPAISDTDAYPAHGCKPASGYTACVTDAQLQTELRALVSGHGLPSDLAHIYVVFFPTGVETEDSDGTNSDEDYCGYHSVFGTGDNLTVYINLPYDSSGCDVGQAPNGVLAADGGIDTLSHELNESITDPADQIAWNDKNSNENADMCLGFYGRALGSTDSSSPGSTEYNQVINGGRYYTQDEFSNYAFNTFGAGKGCQPNETDARNATLNRSKGAGATHANLTAFAEASPNALPADGSSTSSVDVNVTDANGDAVQGDQVHFSVSTKQGSGRCGTLSRPEANTDSNGDAIVTYKASGSNVECWLQAVDAEGGQVSQSAIYQGSTQKYAPSLNASFPSSVAAGGSAMFTMTAANPSTQPVKNVSIELDVFQGDNHSPNVDAGQVQLAYSTSGPGGPFHPISLSGSTGDGYSISGTFNTADGQTIPPGTTEHITVRLSLAASAPADRSGPLIALEAYLDQVNDANGSGATLGDTYASNIDVTGGVPQGSGGTPAAVIGAAAGGAVLVAVAASLFLLRRRRRGRALAS